MLKETKEPSPRLEDGELTSERSDTAAAQPAPARPTAKAKPKKSAQSQGGMQRAEKSDAAEDDFDYSQISDPTLRDRAREAAERIRESLRLSSPLVLRIGKTLLEMKDALDHGEFLLWRNAAFPGSAKTATDWQKIAEVFDGKPHVVKRFGPTALARLAHLDQEIRERVLAQIDANKGLTLQKLKALIRTTEAERKTIIGTKKGARISQLTAATPKEAAILAAPLDASDSVPASAIVPEARERRAANVMRSEAEALPAKYGAPLRELLPIIRPQAMRLIDSVEDVAKRLATALKEGDSESAELRARLGTTLHVLYFLAGTDRETETGPERRLVGRWQAIEQTLRRLDESLAETTPKGAAVIEQFRRAKKALAQLLV